MSIHQTRDILEYVKKFHEKLSDFYEDLGNQTDKERLKILLDYMSRHQKNFGIVHKLRRFMKMTEISVISRSDGGSYQQLLNSLRRVWMAHSCESNNY